MDINDYKKTIDTLFQAESSEPITNSDASHAIVLLSAIFHYAHKTVDVFCGNLKKVVFSDPGLVAEIRCAAFRDVKIRFILQEEKLESNDVLNIQEQLRGSNIEIHHIAPEKNKNLPFHFTVADKKSFRFEEDHDGVKALGCANHPEIARMFDKKFNQLLGICVA